MGQVNLAYNHQSEVLGIEDTMSSVIEEETPSKLYLYSQSYSFFQTMRFKGLDTESMLDELTSFGQSMEIHK